ncbi:flagellar hook assembly protein FlgD [Nitrospira sp. Kam-Ns4a]
MDSITGLSRQTVAAPPAPASGGSPSLGQDVFLKLLVTQLQYQNPLQPVNNETFIGQLAQFSQLEQMTQLVTLMEQSRATQQTQEWASLVALLGRQVQLGGPIIQHGTGPTTMFYTLAEEAERVQVTLLDAAGRPVRTIQAGAQPAGAHQLSWDGLDQAGHAAPAGSYHLAISAYSATGQTVAVSPMMQARVTGMIMVTGRPQLLVGGLTVDPTDVQAVF